MIGIEIGEQDQFREQSVPTIFQIEGQEIETPHKSVVSPASSPKSVVSPGLLPFHT